MVPLQQFLNFFKTQRAVYRSLLSFSTPSFLICTLLNLSNLTYAQAPSLYLDADQSLFSNDGKQQIFIGHVVAIGPNVLVSADKITLDKRINRIEASGHALLMSEGQVFTGSLISFDLFNEDLYIENAYMVTKEKGRAEKVISDILGFTTEELKYETFRKTRLKEISDKKQSIIAEAQILKKEEDLNEDLVEQLALLLEQEKLTSSQQNPILSRMSKETRGVYLRRRKFWEEGKNSAFSVGSTSSPMQYIKLKASTLSRVQGNDYRAKEIMFTPCKCEDDENPPWAIKANQVKAQMGGYLNFYDSYLEVAGLPVLYLPFLKLPVKSERQSGFLAPNFYSSTETGTVFSAPIFLAFAKHADLTLLPELIEKRGTRLGLEYRQKNSESSKWTIGLDVIKDSQWLQETSDRNAVSDAVLTGLEEARLRSADIAVDDSLENEAAFREAVKNPSYWSSQPLYAECLTTASAEELNKCKNVDIRSQLIAPENFWRGKLEWQGVEYIAPRFSVESYGDFLSDHRYVEELVFSRDFNEAVDEEKVKTFGSAKYRLNLDSEIFSLSVGGDYGDYLLEGTSWAGQQLPFFMDLSSPLVNIYHSEYLKLYLRGVYELNKIEVSDFEFPLQTEGSTYKLSDGVWRRAYADLIAPFLQNTVANSHAFVRFERRDITPTGRSDLETSITSYRAGVEFKVPMEGEAEIMRSAEKAESDSFYAGTYLEHQFSLGARFSIRPYADKEGKYGENIDLGILDDSGNPVIDQQKYTYFASDQSSEVANSFSVNDETMFKHQKITLFTSHSFGTFDKRWVKKGLDAGSIEESSTSREKAREILLRAMDREVTSVDQITEKDQYTLEKSNREVPVTLAASISYDFIKAKERDELEESFEQAVEYNEQAKELEEELVPLPELPEAWSDLVFDARAYLNGFRLSYHTEYNIYSLVATESNWGIFTPEFGRTTLGLSFTDEITANMDDLGRLVPEKSSTKGIQLVSKIVPNFNFVANYFVKEIDGTDQIFEKHTQGIQFLPSSQCWGLNFVRNKPYELSEDLATYRLELNVVIDGQARAFPNMAGAILKHFPDGVAL